MVSGICLPLCSGKGGKQRITVEPPLIVYNKDGSYTDEIYQIYGEMKN